jgi:hypothetical protein
MPHAFTLIAVAATLCVVAAQGEGEVTFASACYSRCTAIDQSDNSESSCKHFRVSKVIGSCCALRCALRVTGPLTAAPCALG